MGLRGSYVPEGGHPCKIFHNPTLASKEKLVVPRYSYDQQGGNPCAFFHQTPSYIPNNPQPPPVESAEKKSPLANLLSMKLSPDPSHTSKENHTKDKKKNGWSLEAATAYKGGTPAKMSNISKDPPPNYPTPPQRISQ